MDSRQSDFFFFWNLTQSSHSSDMGIYVCSATVVKTRYAVSRIHFSQRDHFQFHPRLGSGQRKGPPNTQGREKLFALVIWECK